MAQYDVFTNPSGSAAEGIPYVVVVQSDLDSVVVLRSRSSTVLKLSSNRRDGRDPYDAHKFRYFIDEMSLTILTSFADSSSCPWHCLVHFLLFSAAVLGSDSSGSPTPGSRPQVIAAELSISGGVLVDDSIL
jgi:hypothetical protein